MAKFHDLASSKGGPQSPRKYSQATFSFWLADGVIDLCAIASACMYMQKKKVKEASHTRFKRVNTITKRLKEHSKVHQSFYHSYQSQVHDCLLDPYLSHINVFLWADDAGLQHLKEGGRFPDQVAPGQEGVVGVKLLERKRQNTKGQ